ncbi:MAG: peroxiredoxin [Myxococcales bacterium]|nr:peroxiredoxin [Myxococcales bacterium]|tara:strand:+ start:615 stop:1076 length:462 start_codon:yes stop_codon:yes gene_type:complete
MPELNALAPDFDLRSTNGDNITLSGLRGQKVVLAFYPAAFTGVCEKEMCTFRDSLSGFNTMNATVLGISVDLPFSIGAFAKQNELNFPLLSDHDRTTIHAYDVAFPNFAGLPGYTVAQRAVFVVDEEGILRYQWTAPNPGVEPDYDEVAAQLK